jgi:WS/DGAT/MGAT family acyltransferase
MRRLSGLDAASLALEAAATPLHMTAVLVFDTSTVPGGYSYERLRHLLASRMHVVPPLLQRLQVIPGRVHRPVWVDAPTIDWEYHLPRVISTERLDLRRLEVMAAELLETRLDRGRPLWQLQVVEDPTQERIAIMARVHHALMDGLGGVEFMAQLFELEPSAPALEPLGRLERHPSPSRTSLLADAVRDLSSMPATAARVASDVVRTAARLVSEPRDAEQRAARPFGAPRTIFNGNVTAARTVSLSEYSFVTVRRIASQAQCTVNDVVLAACSGALRRYLLERDQLPGRRLVAGVPAATSNGDSSISGNAFSFLFVRLTTDIDDPIERLTATIEEASVAKRAAAALGMQTLGDVLDLFTPPPLDVVLSAYRSVLVGHAPPLWNVIVSNVPGPPVPLYLGGARLTNMFPLGPIYENLGLNITVLSREASLEIGIVACTDLVDEPRVLAGHIDAALAELAVAYATRAPAPVSQR